MNTKMTGINGTEFQSTRQLNNEHVENDPKCKSNMDYEYHLIHETHKNLMYYKEEKKWKLKIK